MISFIRHLFKPKSPKETPEESVEQENIPNHTYDFLEYVKREQIESYIECFCPWVKYDSLSEEDKERFAKLSGITYGIAEGWIPAFIDPRHLDEFEGLIPEPTDEEFNAYIESLLRPNDSKEELCAIDNPEQVLESTPQ